MPLSTHIDDIEGRTHEISSTAATIYSYRIRNRNAYPIYLKFYNKLAANVSVNDTPDLTLTIPGSTTASENDIEHAFSTALSVRCSCRNVNSDTIIPAISPEIELMLSPSGGGVLKSKIVTLTDAQIRALSTFPYPVLVPALGANKALVPVFAVLRSHIVTAYTNLDPNATLCIWNSALGGFELTAVPESPGGKISDLLATVADKNLVLPIAATFDAVNGVTPFNTSDVSGNNNMALQAELFNGTNGDLTGGDPANFLRVTIVYLEVDQS